MIDNFKNGRQRENTMKYKLQYSTQAQKNTYRGPTNMHKTQEKTKTALNKVQLRLVKKDHCCHNAQFQNNFCIISAPRVSWILQRIHRWVHYYSIHRQNGIAGSIYSLILGFDLPNKSVAAADRVLLRQTISVIILRCIHINQWRFKKTACLLASI